MPPISGYFDYPFAVDGDLNTIPDATQPSGTVSYQQGFPVGYSTAVSSGGFNVPRTAINQALNDVTTAIQLYQQTGIPPFITTAMNNGTPFSYSQYNQVMYGGVAYQSLVNSNTDTPPSVKWMPLNFRQRLTGGTNFYVSTTGSDSNNGLTSGTAWLTLAHAVSQLIQYYDGAGYNPTINIGTGTFAGVDITLPFLGGTIIIVGNSTTITGGIAVTGIGCAAEVENIAVTNSGGACLSADQGGVLVMGSGMTVEAASTAQLSATNQGKLFVSTAFSLSGNSTALLSARDGGLINVEAAALCTVTAAVSITTVAAATLGGIIDAANLSFTGSAVTGTRYSASGNGIINTNGGGANFFPGTIAGSTAAGGQYI